MRSAIEEGITLAESEVEPDVFLYTAAIAQCARAGDVAGAETLLRLMQRRDQAEPNPNVGAVLGSGSLTGGSLRGLGPMHVRGSFCGLWL